MNRRHHHNLHNIQPYDYDRFNNMRNVGTSRTSRDRDFTAAGIEYQDDSLSSVNSDEDSYLRRPVTSKEKKDTTFFGKVSSSSKPDKSANTAPSYTHQHHQQKDTNRESNYSHEHHQHQQQKDTNRDSNYSHEHHKHQQQKDTNREASKAQTNTSNSESTSTSTTERLSRLENMIETLLKRNTVASTAPPAEAKPQHQTMAQESKDGRYLLEPRRHDFTTSMWISKIQDVAIQTNYSEKSTIKFMESQMSGIIKAWYKSLPNHDFSWPEWKLLITKVFPDNLDFITTLKRLVTRIKQADETMTNYYFSKMYLLEACKITGEDAVSCLIDGLNNHSIQERAKLENYLTPETLFSQFLMTLPDYTVDYSPVTAAGPVSHPENSGNWYYPGPEADPVDDGMIEISPPVPDDFPYESEGRHVQVDKNFSFHHPEDITFEDVGATLRSMQFEPPPKRIGPVHSRLDKRFIKSSKFTHNKVPLASKLCTICHNRGHLARNCRNVNKVLIVDTPNNTFKDCYFKNCTIDGEEIYGFIDTGCTGVLIRSDCVKNIQMLKNPTSDDPYVVSYGGNKIEILGEFESFLQIDDVEAFVKVLIMPKDAQEVPLIVGQSFLNQTGVGFTVDNDKLSVFKTCDNVD